MILNASLPNHPYNCYNDYYKKDLTETISILESKLSKKQVEHIVNHKLQFNKSNFDINQYIQSACELSIISTIIKLYPNDFKYEPKLNIESKENKAKDVDLSFTADKIRINVEVKCFNQKDQESTKTSVTLSTPQLPTEFYTKIQKDIPDVNFCRSRLRSINDFFDNSIKKFGKKTEQEFNILMICCYDLYDYIDVLQSIGGIFGISYNFNKSFLHIDGNIDVNNYQNIDAIIVSNLAFNHKESGKDKNLYLNPWNARYSFSLGLQLHKDHATQKNDSIGFIFKKAFNLHNDALMSYCQSTNINHLDYPMSIPKYVEYLNSLPRGYYFQY